jgi:hypothetical protein
MAWRDGGRPPALRGAVQLILINADLAPAL